MNTILPTWNQSLKTCSTLSFTILMIVFAAQSLQAQCGFSPAGPLDTTIVLDNSGIAEFGGADLDANGYSIDGDSMGVTCVSWIFFDGNGNQIGSTSEDANTPNPVQFFCADIGDTTIYARTDTSAAGDALSPDSLQINITVEDQSDPTLTGCPSDTISTTEPDTCAGIVSFTAPSVNDNCDSARLYYDSEEPFEVAGAMLIDPNTIVNDTFPVGMTDVAFVVEDTSGNIDSCVFTITINDNTAPTISCPLDMTFNVEDDANPMDCTYEVSTDTLDAGAMDICSIDTLFNDYNGDSTLNGAFFSTGMTEVVWTAIDSSGNSSSCTVTITVQDTTAPDISCHSDETYNINADGNTSDCVFTVSTDTLDPSVTDACSSFSLINDVTGDSTLQGADFPIGTTPVVWTATDTFGNSDSCVINITVIDTTAPDFVFSPNPDTFPACGDTMTVYSTAMNCLPEVTYQRPVADNVEECELQSITESFIGSTPAGVDPYQTSADTPDYADAEFGLGLTEVRFVATDFSGNQNTCSIYINVQDTFSPTVASCPGNEEIGSICDSIPLPDYRGSVGFNDNCNVIDTLYQIPPPDSTTLIEANGGNDPMDGDTFTVQVFADDISGNRSDTCTIIVTLRNDSMPVLAMDSLPLISPATMQEAGCGSVVLEAPIAFICNNDTIFGELDGPGPFNNLGNNQYEFLPGPGNYTVTWEYEAPNGQFTEQDQQFMITSDTVAPLVKCPGDITLNPSTGNCDTSGIDSISIVEVATPMPYTADSIDMREFTDNCGVETVQYALSGATVQPFQDGVDAGVATFNPGVTTVTYNVIDSMGNSTSCSFTVTVEDDENPVITNCPPDDSVQVEMNACIAVYTFTAPSVSDNCDSLTLTYDNGMDSVEISPGSTVTDTLDPFADQSPELLFTVTDQTGNSATCTSEVTIVDTIPPNLTCHGDVTYSLSDDTSPGDCSFTLNSDSLNASVSDPCPVLGPLYFEDTGGSVVLLDSSSLQGISFPVGTTDIIVVAENDAPTAGSVFDSCFFSITVEDNQSPSLTCPAPDTISAEVDSCVGITTINHPNVMDNCDSVILTYLPGNGPAIEVEPGGTTTDTFPLGTTNYGYTVTDTSGNSSSCTSSVTVEDMTSPAIACPSDVTFLTSEDGMSDFNYTVSSDSLNATSADTCSMVSITNDFNNNTTLNGADFPIGVTTVVWTATDSSNNTSTCVVNVTVQNDQPPVFAFDAQSDNPDCGDTMTVNSTPTNCNPLVSFQRPVSDDVDAGNLDTIIQEFIPDTPSGVSPYNFMASSPDFANGNFDLGHTQIRYIAIDENGLSDTCSIFINMVDTIDPVVAFCPTDQTINSTCDSIPFPDYRGSVGFNDNCGNLIDTMYQSPAPDTPLIDANGGMDPMEGNDITVMVWADDISGNRSDTCTFTVTLSNDSLPVPAMDSLPPVNPATTPLAGCGGPIVVTAPIAFVCDNDTVFGTTSSPFATQLSDTTYEFANGDYNVTWDYQATPGGPEVNQVQQFMITQDTFAPLVECPGDVTASTAPDECDTMYIPGIAVTEVSAPFPYTQDSLSEGEYTDNCSVGAVEYELSGATMVSRTPGTDAGVETFNAGATTVTYYVTDTSAAGVNEASCTFTVTVEDDEAPMITCPSEPDTIQVAMDTCAGIHTFNNPTVSDNCPVTLEYDPDNGPAQIVTPGALMSDTFPVGTTTDITYTVSDAAGNTATCTFSVTVQDTVSPTITCAADVTFNLSNGNPASCSFTLNSDSLDAMAADTCGIQSLTNDYNSSPTLTGEDFPVGTTTIVWTATDAYGNTSTCAHQVTVEDDEAPVFSFIPVADNPGCGQTDTIYTNNADCVPLVSWQRPTFEDVEECSLDTITEEFFPSDPNGLSPYNDSATSNQFEDAEFQAGITEIRYIAEDVNGLRDTCSLFIHVIDTVAPTVADCNDVTVSSICDSVQLPDFRDANDFLANCGLIDTMYQDPVPGTYLVDANGGDPMDGDQFDVQYWAADTSGNVSDTCVFTVTLQNDSVPIPTVSSLPDVDATTNLNAGCGSVIVSAPTATICNGDTILYGIPNEGSNQGNNEWEFDPSDGPVITWTYTAPSGVDTTQMQNVNVTADTAAPQIACPASVTVNPSNATCDTSNISGIAISFVAPSLPYGPGNVSSGEYTDNCGVDTVYYELSGATTVPQQEGVNAGVETFNPGLTTVTYTVEDDQGNTASCSFTVTVIDDEAPVITCPSEPDTIQLAMDTCAGITAVMHPTVTDNCDSVALFYNPGNGPEIEVEPGGSTTDTFPVGMTNIVYTVVDSAGNTTSCATSVVVQDTVNPIVNCPSDVTLFTSEDGILNDCGVMLSSDSLDATAADTCGIMSLTNNLNGDSTLNGFQFDLGDTTVIWTATDFNGNTTTCSYTVTVEDDDAPVFTSCPGNDIVSAVDCGNEVDFTIAVDECNFDSFSYSVSDPNVNITIDQEFSPDSIRYEGIFPNGTSTVTFTATDTAGNSSTCSFDVTITPDGGNEPDISCNDVTVNLDSSGQFVTDTFEAGFLYTIQTPPCGEDSVVVDLDTVTCANLGANNFNVTIFGEGGDSATCTGTMTVVDPLNPYVECQSDTTLHLPDTMNAVATLSATSVIDSSWDNCTIDSFLISKDGMNFETSVTYDCSEVGPQTATIRVVDNSGNSSTCTVTVMVQDTTSPGVASCPSDTMINTSDGGTGECAGELVFNHPDAVDNCTVDSMTVEYTLSTGMTVGPNTVMENALDSFDFPAGTNTVQYVVYDVNGNTSDSCSYEVMVADDEDPMAFCPTDTTVTTSGDSLGNMDCGYTATGGVFDLDSIVDNCVIDSVYHDYAAAPMDTTLDGAVFPPGDTITVTWTVLDSAGNTGSCSFDVMVEDDEAPMVDCPGDVTLESGTCDDDFCWTVDTLDNCMVDTVFAYFIDEDGNLDTTINYFSTGCNGEEGFQAQFEVGTTQVFMVARDTAGNADTCSFEVTVSPTNNPPSVDCTDDYTGYLDSMGQFVLDTVEYGDLYTFSSVCDLDTVIVDPDTVGCSDVEEVQFTVTVVEQGGQTGMCTGTMTLLDTLNPYVECQSDTTLHLPDTMNAVATLSATSVIDSSWDNCTIDSFLISKDGMNFDTAVTYECNEIGPQTATIRVVDNSGNSSTCTVTVTVQDTTSPGVASCPSDTMINTSDGGTGECAGELVFNHPDAVDNCTVDSMTVEYTLSTGMTVGPNTVMENALDSFDFPAGTNTVQYVVYDVNGNTSDSCSYDVFVQDDEAPIPVCIGDTTVTTSGDGANNYDCAYTVEDGAFDLIDSMENCVVDTAFHDYSIAPDPETLDGAEFFAGTTEVTWTVIDTAGNSATCSFVVTVEDDEDPMFTVCQGDTTINTVVGDCSNQIEFNIEGIENCEMDSFYYSATNNVNILDGGTYFLGQDSFGGTFQGQFPAGETDVQFVAVDTMGNRDTCAFTVTVISNDELTAECEDVTVNLNSDGFYEIQEDDLTDNIYTAECGVDTVFWSQDTVTCKDMSSTDITFTVVAFGGNSDQCVSTVTVVDTFAPVAQCQDTTIYLDATGQMVIDPTFVNDSSFDNTSAECALEFSLSQDTFNCDDTGTNTVILTVTDTFGNTSTCTTTVTVLDTIDPGLAICPTDTTINTSDGGTGDCEGQYVFNHPDAVDNCEVDSLTVEYTLSTGMSTGLETVMEGSLDTVNFPAGTNTVMYVVYDVNGNSSDTCSYEVIVTDDEDPMPVCVNDTTVTTSGDSLGLEDCGYTATDGEFDLVDSMENCVVDSAFHDYAAAPMNNTVDGAVFEPGMTTVTWTVVDTAGNSGTCSFTVTVEDDEMPVFTVCPENDTVPQIGFGGCQQVYNFVAPYENDGVMDNCILDTVIENADGPPGTNPTFININGPYQYDDPNNSSSTRSINLPVGTTTISYTAIDTSGNSSTCSFTVTVTDTTQPDLICQDITVNLDNNGQRMVDPSQISQFSQGNCTDIDTQYLSENTFTCSDLGDNPVILTVVDMQGNSSTCNAIIAVEDNTSPAVNCSPHTASLNSNGEVTVNASDIDGGSSDNCNMTTMEYSVDGGTTYNTSMTFDCSNAGSSVNALLRVTDQSGNTGLCSTTLTIEDGDGPVFAACPTSRTVNTSNNGSGDCTGETTWSTPDPSDNCGTANLTFQYSGATSGSGTAVPGAQITETFNGGTTTVTYTATDVNGNSSTCSFIVTVEDNEDPLITCAPSDTVGTSEDSVMESCSYTVSGGTFNPVSSSDNCPGLNTATHDYGSAPSSTTLDGAELSLGSTEVIWTVTDAEGNTNTCTVTITVEDDETPVFNDCPSNITMSGTINGGCDQNVTWEPPFDIEDNCGINADSVTEFIENPDGNEIVPNRNYDFDNPQFLDPFQGEQLAQFPVGTSTVTYTAYDVNGNSSVCSFSVTITEDDDPNAICEDVTVSIDSNGVATVDPEDVGDNSSDNCSIDTMTLSQSTFDCSDLGDNTVTLTVFDEVGNSDQCTATVTVVDETSPVASCKDVTVALNSNGTLTVMPSDINASDSDNCSVQNREIAKAGEPFGSSIDFGCEDIGDNPVELRVIDSEGNSSSCSATVTVADSTAPALSCPTDMTVNTSSNNNYDCMAYASWTVPVADENCDLEELEVFIFGATNYGSMDALDDQGEMVTYNLNEGLTTIVYKAEDAEGNENSCSFTVTVVDNEAPQITCADDAIVDADSDGNSMDCSYTASGSEFDPNNTSDNCSVSSVTHDYSSAPSNTSLDGADFPLGTTEVVWTAEDDEGNTATCTITITVEDSQAPVVSDCPQDITVQATGGSCDQDVTWDLPFNITDNCNIVSVEEEVDDPTVNFLHDYDFFNPTDVTGEAQFPVGVTTISYIVTDASGNTTECSFTVTVEDSDVPGIVCPPDQSLGTVCPDAELPDYRGLATISDNCGSGYTVNQEPAPDTHLDNIPGITPTDGESFVVTITVTDNEPPFNSANCTFIVTLDDTGAPIPQEGAAGEELPMLNGTICGSGTFTIEPPTAIDPDNCNGNNEIIVAYLTPNNPYPTGITENNDSTYEAENGTYDITWVYDDGEGNTVTQDQEIVVSADNEAPVMSCEDVTVNLDANGNANISPADVDDGSEDEECSISSLSLSQSTFDCSDIGVNTVTLTAEDENGNTAICTAEITVVDNSAPTAICQDITVQISPQGTVSIDPSELDGGSTDNCSGSLTYSASQTTFFCSDVGEEEVTLTVTDANGNTATCTSIVTVEENQAPFAQCRDITVSIGSNGMVEIDPAQVDDGSDDVCGNVTMSISPSTFDCDDTGDNTVTLTVTDEEGDTNSCTATVTVVSDNDLSISCPDPIETCDSEYDVPGPTITGACDLSSLTWTMSGATSGSGTGGPITNQTFNEGTTTITWIATDVSGNTASCSTTINVDYDGTPSAICDDNLIVGLDGAGDATLFAEDVDEGSNTEGCPGIELDFSISVEGGPFVNSHEFECSDIGIHTVVLKVEDDFGNTATCTAQITVSDATPPSASCIGGVHDLVLDAGGNATLNPDDLDDGSTDNCGSVSISASQTDFDCSDVGINTVTLIATDDAGNTSTCNASVNVIDQDAPVVVCQDINLAVPEDGSSVSISPSDIDNGSTDACGSLSMTVSPNSFNCDDEGDQTVLLTVTDGSGNSNTCFATVTVVCDGSIATIEGTITTEDNDGVQFTHVTASGGASDSDQTGTNGTYSLDVLTGSDITVTPFKDTLPKKGLSSLDLVIIQAHILHMDTLSSPYKMIAADVSNNQAISTFDLVQLQSLIVGLTSSFPDNTSWRFVDEDYTFPDPLDPWFEAFPENVELMNADGSENPVDFIGIKIGDVNGTNTGNIQNESGNIESRSGNYFFRTPDQDAVQGEIIEIPVSADAISTLYGYQSTFEWNEALEFQDLEINGILPGLAAENFNVEPENRQMIFNWFNADPVSLQGGETVFTLKFEAREKIESIENILLMSGRKLRSEAYTTGYHVLHFNWRVTQRDEVDEFVLYQNKPNPFDQATNIGFEIPYDSEVRLVIFDDNGKRLYNQRRNYEKGYHEWKLDGNDLPANGILYYRLMTDQHTAVKKMIIQQ